MAAIADVQTVNISINGIDLEVPKGELIVESVKRLGLEIPIFCYHPRMKPVGMCRMCIVEVGFKQPDGSIRKMPKPQAACTLPASEGMAVFTDTEMVHRDRKGVLEFLLINHPLDCPICDRGGECPLQNNTLFYGPSTSRFMEVKRHLPKAYQLSQYVTLDLERCIQCGRCVRFTEEISGDHELAFRFRGAAMQPSTFELREFESKFSGNVIEICPVGALTSAKYRFRARPWDLETQAGICTLCSNGCNVWLDYRVGKVVRVNGRTNEAINEEWTCDKGKFGHDFYNSSARLTTPMVRKGNQLVQTDWAEAYAGIIEQFKAADGQVAVIANATQSNEDLYLLQKLFREHFGSSNLDTRLFPHAPARQASSKQSIQSYEKAKSILIFGTSLADDLPILFLRVRKAWAQNGTRVVVATDKPTDADKFAEAVLRYRSGTEQAFLSALESSLAGSIPVDLEQTTGVSTVAMQAAVSALQGNAPMTISTWNFYKLPNNDTLLSELEAITTAQGGVCSCYGLQANDEGAERVLESKMTTQEILEACADGRIKALWISGFDLLKAHPDRELVERAISAVPYLVFQGISSSEGMHYASVVLPSTAPLEQDGSYTNLEGTTQRLEPLLAPKGDAKPLWRIASELCLRIQPRTPYFSTAEVMNEISRTIPGFNGFQYSGHTPDSTGLVAETKEMVQSGL